MVGRNGTIHSLRVPIVSWKSLHKCIRAIAIRAVPLSQVTVCQQLKPVAGVATPSVNSLGIGLAYS